MLSTSFFSFCISDITALLQYKKCFCGWQSFSLVFPLLEEVSDVKECTITNPLIHFKDCFHHVMAFVMIRDRCSNNINLFFQCFQFSLKVIFSCPQAQSPGQTIATLQRNISQHRWAQIVKMVKFEPTTANILQLVNNFVFLGHFEHQRNIQFMEF